MIKDGGDLCHFRIQMQRLFSNIIQQPQTQYRPDIQVSKWRDDPFNPLRNRTAQAFCLYEKRRS